MQLRVVVFAAVWSGLTTASVTVGQLYEWPDFVHVRYGVPFAYAVHTLSTIAGPADFWMVDMASLTADLVLWLAGLVCGVALLLSRGEKKINSKNDQGGRGRV
ncbi:MAG: hypothetical protein QXT90_05335 [Candidatus Caldarchaeum sp.]